MPGPDEFVRGSRFVLIFHVDGKQAVLLEGWANLLTKIQQEIIGEDDPESYSEDERERWDHIQSEIEDEDNWETDDRGWFHYRTEIGDGGGLHVYRLWD